MVKWVLVFFALVLAPQVWRIVRSLWGIPAGTRVDVRFDLVAPSKAVADHIGRELSSASIAWTPGENQEEQEWLCSVYRRGIAYDLAHFDEIKADFHHVAAGHGGYCNGYTVQCGDRVQAFFDDAADTRGAARVERDWVPASE